MCLPCTGFNNAQFSHGINGGKEVFLLFLAPLAWHAPLGQKAISSVGINI